MKHSVIPHKMRINPDTISLLIIDNHGSRFSTDAIDLCLKNKIEVLCYPGHLTHILQGPDVLNKPLKTNVDAMIQNNMLLTGNSMINRLNFINKLTMQCAKHAQRSWCRNRSRQLAFYLLTPTRSIWNSSHQAWHMQLQSLNLWCKRPVLPAGRIMWNCILW